MTLFRSALAVSCSALLVIVGGCSSTTTGPTPVVKQGTFSTPTGTTEFGGVVLGHSADMTDTMSNTGNDTIVITKVTMSGATQITLKRISNDAMHSVLPLRIAPMTKLTIVFTCAPMDVGDVNATSVITTQRAKDSSVRIVLHGTGVGYRAQIGDGYLYGFQSYDGGGSPLSSGNDTTTIIDDNVAWMGKSAVLLVDQNEGSSTGHYRFESNGDISYYYPSDPAVQSFGAMWVTLPFSSKQAVSNVVWNKDTSINVGTPLAVHQKVTASYFGVDSVRINGAYRHVLHAQALVSYTTVSNGDVIFAHDFYYSPLLGFFAMTQTNLSSTLHDLPFTVTPSSQTDTIANYHVH